MPVFLCWLDSHNALMLFHLITLLKQPM